MVAPDQVTASLLPVNPPVVGDATALLGRVLGPQLVTQGHCLIASGPSGSGKTQLAVAFDEP